MNLQKLASKLLPLRGTTNLIQVCAFKNFPAPENYDHISIPDRPKLRFMDKVPQYPPTTKPPKMQKKLHLMRGPELIHNKLVHKQYGIMALGGGRLRFGHLEMLRLTIGRKMDTNRMFAVWRIDAPWQPVTKKGQGQRMGGGKGAIDHYVTPVKAGRIILEVAGKCEYAEVKRFLEDLAMKMPFKAMAVSQEILDEMKLKEEEEEKCNVNEYTMKYVIQNNLGGCQKWLRPNDMKYFGKYL
ncbi:PREDICTED: 39S ribosomal protein L16, mitochondrial [Nicrophorus vespilloides]|uniref:Large ribosomal subunit protein uL16m n=1 Tax=Nicrophorus vespilloides TaxID=110193 RepID=A0ABM1MZM6_NICVS|nr:PREDICTED: 39S ribosomal protein L16, mitochondrial [Nicrophorus vespilloides]